MPAFKFTSPDGKAYTVNGPDGATEQQAFQMLQSQLGAPASAPAPAPAKPFGQQMNDTIAAVPRQLGLTARYGLEGVGNALDFLATPIRAGLNAVTPNAAPTIADQVAGRKPAERFQPGGGKALADLLHLPEPQTSGERIVGDATRMLAGGAVPIAGAAKVAQGATGVTKAVAQTLAGNPLQQLVSAGASGVAGGYTRETGGNATSQMLASIAGGVAAPLATNKLTQAAAAVGRLGGRAAPDPAQIDITINNALQPSGMTLGDLPYAVQAGIRQDVADAYRISGSTSANAIRRLADYRLVGATPTAAGLTLDPAIVSQQKNLAKLGINSKDTAAQALGQTENANNRQLIGGLNDLGAGTADTAIAGGRRVMGALADRDATAAGLIDARYAAARGTNGRSAELDPEAFVNSANAKLNEALLSGKVPQDVRNLLNKEWVDVMRGAPATPTLGQPPAPRFTVDMAEQMKTRIGDLQRASTDISEKKALGLVRQALDDTPLLDGQGQGAIDAFNKARALHRAWMGIVEKTPALQAVRDGVEPDKFVQQFIVGGGPKANVADLAALRQSVKASPDAMAAVREQIVSHLKAKALNGSADEVGNMSQSAYNKALSAIGDEKLGMFFAPSEVSQLKAIGRVASYEQVQPKGAAVNNSNTAGTAMANILDRIGGSSVLSKIPLANSLQQPIQNIAVGMKSSRALSVPNALVSAAQLQEAVPRGLMMSPALLMGGGDEKRKR